MIVHLKIIKLDKFYLLFNCNMTSSIPFSERIDVICKDKQSNLILAIDPKYGTNNLFTYVLDLITKLGKYICSVK